MTVKGKNVNLYVYRGGSYVLAVCSTDLSRRQSTNTLTTLVRGAGRARRYKPTINEETLTLEGLRTIDTTSQFQIHEFIIGQFYTVRIIYDDLAGNTIQLDGQVLITEIDDNNNASDFSTWSISMVRNGTWSMTGTGAADVVAPYVVSARAIGPHTVRVTFSENVVPTTPGFVFRIAVSTSSFTAVSGSGTVWDFTTLPSISPGDTLTMDYNSSTGNTLDLAGNEMASFALFPVENNVVAAYTFTGYLREYSSNPVGSLSAGVDILVWDISATFTGGGPMAFNISSITGGKWVAMKEPDTEPAKLNWFNTALNNGTIGDSVFYASFTASGFRYYVSRNPIALTTSQPLTVS